MAGDAEGLDGPADLAVHLTCDADHVAYVLICNKIISTVVLTQRRNNTTYISYVDSSGYNRGFSTSFITAVLRSIPGLVVCFSYPKKEPILGSSSKNPGKNMMSPSRLFSYWRGIFDERCTTCPQNNMSGGADSTISSDSNAAKKVRPAKSAGLASTDGDVCYTCTWSNFTSLKSHPYRDLDEIEMFDDDPKSKMVSTFRKVNSGSINDVFEGLLVRTDFLRGGLLFSRCFANRPPVPGQSPAGGHKGENIRSHGGCGLSNIRIFQNEIERVMLCSSNASAASSADRVSRVVKKLQISDFSSQEEALKSTARFVEESEMCPQCFRMERDVADGGKCGDAVSKIVPRTRK